MKNYLAVLVVAVFLSFTIENSVNANNTVSLSSVINQGALMADIRNSIGNILINPIINMGSVKDAKKCRVSDGFSAKMFSSNRRMYVSNPNAADNGWTLTMTAKGGQSSFWHNNGGASIDFNDASGGGCSDGDSDGAAGLLRVDLTQAQINSDCKTCTNNSIFKGANQQDFSQGAALTIFSAANASDDLGRWYIEGVDLKQTVPKNQPGGEYLFEAEFTVTAS